MQDGTTELAMSVHYDDYSIPSIQGRRGGDRIDLAMTRPAQKSSPARG